MPGTFSHEAIRRAMTRSLHGPRRSQASVDGTPPTPCGLNTCDRAAQRPGARGDLVQVGPGAGGQHRAGVIEDPVGDDPALAGALGGHDEHLVLHPGVGAPEPLAAAEAHRVVGRCGTAAGAGASGPAGPGGRG